MKALRRKYFPRHLNRTPAHLTLFHALPHSELDRIRHTLSALSQFTQRFKLSTGIPFRLRRGIAIPIFAGKIKASELHKQMQDEWWEMLSEQDQQRWRGHWTVMNKIDTEEEVEKAFLEVQQEPKREGWATGMRLWAYEAGRWGEGEDFDFQKG